MPVFLAHQRAQGRFIGGDLFFKRFSRVVGEAHVRPGMVAQHIAGCAPFFEDGPILWDLFELHCVDEAIDLRRIRRLQRCNDASWPPRARVIPGGSGPCAGRSSNVRATSCDCCHRGQRQEEHDKNQESRTSEHQSLHCLCHLWLLAFHPLRLEIGVRQPRYRPDHRSNRAVHVLEINLVERVSGLVIVRVHAET